MNAPSESPRGRRTISVCLVVVLLALIPHLAKSTSIGDGLVVGSQASTNTMGSTSSVMVGSYNYGAGSFSLAVGNWNYLGESYNGAGSIAVGTGNWLLGVYNFAFGGGNIVAGTHAMAIGQSNSAYGNGGLVYGSLNQAESTAAQALAGGRYNIVRGENAVVFGNYATANSYASLVIGQHNKILPGEGDADAKTQWRGTDPLFVIGNGSDSGTGANNAVLVTKDGTVTIKRIPPQGDVSMGMFYE